MKKIALLPFGLLLLTLFIASLAMPVNAGTQPQVFLQTPTAMPDGRILYIVKAGDTCLSISLQTSVSLDQLRTLNNIKGDDCPLRENQELLLGLVDVQQPTAVGPTASPTPLLPSPTPFNGNGTICVLIFEDVNGNALADTDEKAIAGGVISVSDRTGKVSLTGNSDASGTPVCFEKVPEGEYNISAAVPDGYNATTDLNYALKLRAGDQATVDFVAQTSSTAPEARTAQPSSSPLLGIVGGLLILGGLGLGFYFWSIRRK